MKKYLIKWLDDNGVYVTADNTPIEAENEGDALKQFAILINDGLLIQDVEIVDDDPSSFTLRIKSWFHNPESKLFETYEGLFEYAAYEVE